MIAERIIRLNRDDNLSRATPPWYNHSKMMSRILIIAIGNPLRSDDGLAWRVADELGRDSRLVGTEILTIHQLTPETAEPASQADLVIFVDAAATGEPGALHCEEITAADESASLSHSLTPQSVIMLGKTLYGKRPKAFLVSVSGNTFEHGESLSPEVQRSIPLVLAKIRELIRGGS